MTVETFPPSQLAQHSPLARRNSLILVLGFALIILVGTVLLRLPWAGSHRALTWEEALFISTSATTVTGLVVITPAVDLSLFGQIVVLVLMDIGGVGFIAFSVLLFTLIGRRVGYTSRMLIKQSLGVFEGTRIVRFTLIVLAATLLVQLLGAGALWLRWRSSLGDLQGAYLALFHAVSAFCNAGFDLFSGTGTVLFGYADDAYTLSVMMALIIIGGLGILVGVDLLTYYWDRRLTVHTRLTLVVTLVLYILGLGIVMADFAFEGTAFAGLGGWERFWRSLFTVVSARTAGLTIVPLSELGDATALTIMLSMFIGGAPASMAGGVTISTVAVLLVAVQSTVRGLPQAVAFGRTLPLETIAKAVAIMTVSSVLCFLIALVLLATHPSGGFLAIVFEVISAFSNTGYSLGMTSRLNSLGRLLIAFTMFWGRLGPLTLVVLLAQRERPTYVRYPSEQVVLG
ncbi:MAG: potassium transporter [Caldilineae bacterium]|nr:MAG: potassium transporter [Caldilineae bacterium]